MHTEMVYLRDLVSEIRNGLDADQHDEPLDDDMLPITRIETISASVIDFSRVKYARVSVADQKKYRLRPGDVLFSHINSPEHIGKTAIFRSDRILIHGINLLLLRPKPEKCYPEYLNYFLSSADVRVRFKTRCKKAVNQASLNHDDVVSLEVPLPPLPEQQRIAAILERADRLRRLRRYALELSEGYLQAVFVGMFGESVRNPMGWPEKTLAQLRVKFSYGTSAKCFSEPQGLPVLRIPNVLSREISLDDLKYAELSSREVKALTLRRGDLLFVRTNGNPDYVGRCAVFDLEKNFLFASYLIRARLDSDGIDPWYLDTFLRAEGGRRAMEPYIRTTAGQSNIGMEGLGQIAVPIPSRVLQERFADIVSKHSRLQIQQREALRQAEELFGALLDRAFRGEV